MFIFRSVKTCKPSWLVKRAVDTGLSPANLLVSDFLLSMSAIGSKGKVGQVRTVLAGMLSSPLFWPSA